MCGLLKGCVWSQFSGLRGATFDGCGGSLKGLCGTTLEGCVGLLLRDYGGYILRAMWATSEGYVCLLLGLSEKDMGATFGG